MKAYWQGTLSCDLINIPVKLYAAVIRHEPRFHYLHAQCGSPIEYTRHCANCDTTVAVEDLVRGYEYDDALVLVDEQDLASLSQKKEHVISLRQCVHADAVDPVSFDRAFYLEPGPGGKKAYALLQAALRQAGMVALGTATLREHERLVLVRPAHEALVLHTLFAHSDLLPLERLALPHRSPQPAELAAVEQSIARLSGPYIAEQWVDQSHAPLLALLARKAKTAEGRLPAGRVPPGRKTRARSA